VSLVALLTWRDLLFCAKHLFVEAIVSRMRKSHRRQRLVLAASRGDPAAIGLALPQPWPLAGYFGRTLTSPEGSLAVLGEAAVAGMSMGSG
jgi:hypothetical protein